MHMTPARQGAAFQDDFADWWRALGKRAWLYRFADAAHNYGRNQRLTITDEQPADFLCAYAGRLALVECKSTQDAKGFKRSLIERAQLKSASESILAGTLYFFAVRNENTRQVFLIPAKWVMEQRSILRWDDLKYIEWKGDRECLPDLLR